VACDVGLVLGELTRVDGRIFDGEGTRGGRWLFLLTLRRRRIDGEAERGAKQDG
jgi:hypothetical protein